MILRSGLALSLVKPAALLASDKPAVEKASAGEMRTCHLTKMVIHESASASARY